MGKEEGTTFSEERMFKESKKLNTAFLNTYNEACSISESDRTKARLLLWTTEHCSNLYWSFFNALYGRLEEYISSGTRNDMPKEIMDIVLKHVVNHDKPKTEVSNTYTNGQVVEGIIYPTIVDGLYLEVFDKPMLIGDDRVFSSYELFGKQHLPENLKNKS